MSRESLSNITIINIERKFNNIFSDNDVNEIFGNRKCRNKLKQRKTCYCFTGCRLCFFKLNEAENTMFCSVIYSNHSTIYIQAV